MSDNLRDKIRHMVGNNRGDDEKEIVAQLKQLIVEDEQQQSRLKESKSIGSLVAESLSRLSETSSQMNLIKSGFDDFDQMFGGFDLGEFVVIGGRPSMGKTQLLVNLALNISVEIPVLYFTFDLPESLLVNRLISSLSGIAQQNLLRYELTDNQKERLSEVEQEVSRHQIFINDGGSDSITALRAHCETMIREKDVKVILIDCLQKMTLRNYRHNRENEINFISRELRSIARDFHVCLIASSQLSRAVETRRGSRRPQLSDLRDSGAIEQDADKVIFIYRPEYYGIEQDEYENTTPGLTQLIMAKNGNGRLGTVSLLRNANFTSYLNFGKGLNEFSFSEDRLDELNS